MKTWNAPVVESLDVRMTENGLFNACVESLILWDKKEQEKTPVES